MNKPEFKLSKKMQLWDVDWFYYLIHHRIKKYVKPAIWQVVKAEDYDTRVITLANLAKELLSYPDRVSNMVRSGKNPTKLELDLVDWVEEKHAEISAYIVNMRSIK
jgi:hypothetical protein